MDYEKFNKFTQGLMGTLEPPAPPTFVARVAEAVDRHARFIVFAAWCTALWWAL